MSIKSKSKNIAVRSNSIVEARFSLTNRQNNILDMLFCEITNDDQYQYEICVDNYKHLYKTDTSNIYRDLKKAVKNFEGKGFTLIDDKTGEEIFYVWFSKIHYIPKQGKIKVNIDLDLKKLMYEVKKKIYYDIEYTLNFSSSYSQRLYYYLKSFEDTGWRIDKIEDLQMKLECPKTYSNFANLKKFVLEVAKQEINSFSDILIDYSVRKTGRKVTHIQFAIKNKSKIIKEEISVTSIEDADKEKFNIREKLADFNLTEEEINKIMSACKVGFENSKEEDIEKYFNSKLEIVINYCKYKKINIVGSLIKALKENWSNNNKVNSNQYNQLKFNNFEARDYDYKSLEWKLLGWE